MKHYTLAVLIFIIIIIYPTSVGVSISAQEPDSPTEQIFYRHYTPQGASILVPEFMPITYIYEIGEDYDEPRPDRAILSVGNPLLGINLTSWQTNNSVNREQILDIIMRDETYEELETDYGRTLAFEYLDPRGDHYYYHIYMFEDNPDFFYTFTLYGNLAENIVDIVMDSFLFEPNSTVRSNPIYAERGIVFDLPLDWTYRPATSPNIPELAILTHPSFHGSLTFSTFYSAPLLPDLEFDNPIELADSVIGVDSDDIVEVHEVDDVTVYSVTPAEPAYRDTTEYFVFLDSGRILSVEWERYNLETLENLNVDFPIPIITSVRSTKTDEANCEMSFPIPVILYEEPNLRSNIIEEIPENTFIRIRSIQLYTEGRFELDVRTGTTNRETEYYLIWQTDNGWILPERGYTERTQGCYRLLYSSSLLLTDE
ncbi:MAG: hypothetical protein ACFE0Q_21045 [Anaerolineae bacterium]